VQENSQTAYPTKKGSLKISEKLDARLNEIQIFRKFLDHMQSREISDALRRRSNADNPLYFGNFDSTKRVSLNRMHKMRNEIETSVWNENNAAELDIGVFTSNHANHNEAVLLVSNNTIGEHEHQVE